MVNLFMGLIIIMANSPISAIRAAIMMNFLNSATLFRRQNNSLNSLSIAVMIICIGNPYVIYNSGFLLSVTGTFGLAVFGPYMTSGILGNRITHKFIRNVITMMCASLAVMPFSIKYFEEVSIVSPFTNIIILPLCSIAMIIGIIFIVTGGVISFLPVADFLIKLVLFMTDKISKMDMAFFSCGSRALGVIVFGCAFVLLLVQIVFGKRRYTAICTVAVCGVMFIGATAYGMIRRDKFLIAILGQDDNVAVVLTYKDKTEIIDISGHYKSASYVRKYMMENGLSKVDNVVLTSHIYSQYTTYLNALEYIDINGWLVNGNVQLFNENQIVSFGDTGYKICNDNYDVEYLNGILSISFGTNEFCLDISENDMNNCEITLSSDNGYEIRRL